MTVTWWSPLFRSTKTKTGSPGNRAMRDDSPKSCIPRANPQTTWQTLPPRHKPLLASHAGKKWFSFLANSKPIALFFSPYSARKSGK